MVRTVADGKNVWRNWVPKPGEDDFEGGGVDTPLKQRMALGLPAILTPTPTPNASPNAAWRFSMASLYRLGT